MELFHENGHLTDGALHAAIDETLDETGRLEVAEHLSFCDACLLRYTDLLDDGALLTPAVPLAPGVMARARKKLIRMFFNRYAAAAAAVALALVFWGTGLFNGVLPSRIQRAQGAVHSAPVSVSAQFNAFFRDARTALGQTFSGLLPNAQSPAAS